MSHTPTPWTLEVEQDKASDGSIEGYEISIPEINRLFFNPDWADPDEWEQSMANAAFIVQACNSHEALLSALTNLLFHAEKFSGLVNNAPNAIKTAQAALKLAKEIK